MSASSDEPILRVEGLRKNFGSRAVCNGISFDLWPGEVLAVVGESGAGKTSLLKCLSGQTPIDAGHAYYRNAQGREIDVAASDETLLKRLQRTEWGLIHQNPRDGLRFGVSAGANVGERLMALGARHYGNIRHEAGDWLQRLEISGDRIDDLPSKFSGGMQQRLQIARTLITRPRLVFMDEPTGGLDVSVQAKLLDLIRGLVADLGLAVLLVTHDIAAARLLAHRMVVMRHGRVVEAGLTDRVLDDPQHEYTQLLVASVLAA